MFRSCRSSSSPPRCARFATDGSLYVLGFRCWQTHAPTEYAFQRGRYTGKALPAPDKYEVTKAGVHLHFARAIGEELAKDLASYSVLPWNYVRSSQYGSVSQSSHGKTIELAGRAGVSHTCITYIEDGSRLPTADTLKRLFSALSLPLHQIIRASESTEEVDPFE